jgi:ATP-dependent Clp protease ATP-binding subunit ClpC
VILFDEIEKAHSDVINILLQILDDGRLTDNLGRTIDFKNTVIIMTSNIGARKILSQKKLGFSKGETFDENYKSIKQEVLKEVKESFRPEFINRIDEIIVFQKLSETDIKAIIDIMLQKVSKKMSHQNINLKFDLSIKEKIANSLEDTNFGARPVLRIIQRLVEDKLADEILSGKIHENQDLIVKEVDDEVVICVKNV